MDTVIILVNCRNYVKKIQLNPLGPNYKSFIRRDLSHTALKKGERNENY